MDASTQAALSAYLDARRDLITGAEPGLAAARALSAFTDGVVSALAEAALSPLGRPWSVCALGGWGASRLLPGSDIDLLVVTDAPAAGLREALKSVLYPLWDAKLEVGHQVRSRVEHGRAVRDDLATLTATLTGRVVAGDRDLGERTLADCACGAHKRSRSVLRDLAARERMGSPYLLEPDLKEGAGGQRDLDEATWTAAVLAGAPARDPEALVGLGLLSPGELEKLRTAQARIATARWSVHLAAARPSSLITLDIASDLGPEAEAVQSSLADAHHLLLALRERVAGRAPAPVEPIDAEALFALAACGTSALPELEAAAWAGLLDDLVPSFSETMTLRRPGLSHLWTVGAHSLRTVAGLAELPRDDARARHEDARVRDRRALVTAALLHDVGKSQSGPDHPERGAAIARTLAGRFRLDPDAATDCATLVREHLLLAMTAATEDVHDEDVVLRAAARIGRDDLVAALYLLTEADARATGPGAWGPWHAALVGELADRLRGALAEDGDGAGIVESAELARREALSMLDRDADARLAVFVRGAPLRYLAGRRPDEIAAHARLVAELADLRDPADVVVAIGVGPAEGTWKVSVAAADRPGLFASIAGSFALSGLDILAAEGHEAHGGAALDLFVVRPDTLAEAGGAVWATFERTLRATLSSRLDLTSSLMQRRVHYPPRRPGSPRVETGVTGAYATAVRITAPDRVGLLHDIARAVADSGMQIRWLKATTRSGWVRDVLHVVDADGEPLGHGVVGHLAMRLRERLTARSGPQ
ncbi:MAG: HD domain-containing protein [Coriobacteriia bacterium]